MEELIATTPETEVKDVAQEASTEQASQNESNPLDDAEVSDEPEFDEVEYGGNKYRVPKELAPIISKAENLEAGVTRRFQEAAEIKKAADAQLQQFHREQQINSELTQEVSQLTAIESRLTQYQRVNWQQWQATDPQAAQAGMAEMMQLQNSYGQLRGHVEGRKAEIAAIHEHRNATVISDAIEQLSKPDPEKGWAGKFDVSVKENLTKFGRELGYTDEELAGTNHPLMIKTLNLARIGYETLKKQRTAVAPQKAEANPVPQVGAGKSRSSVDPDKLSTEQWLKHRNEQVRKTGR